MEGESSKMPRFRCNKCGRYLKDGARYGLRHQKTKACRERSRFVPRWQRDVWNVVYRVWDDLAAEVHAPGKDSSWRRECVSLVVIKACVRRRGLRDEIAAVALLGSNENIVKLLLERVPGVWGAMTKRWSP